jgi:hypothetical protein
VTFIEYRIARRLPHRQRLAIHRIAASKGDAARR